MNATTSAVRTFGTARDERTIRFGDRRIFVTPAVEKRDGGPLSAYSAHFGRGERAALPAPYEEVWVVISGMLRIRGAGPDDGDGTDDRDGPDDGDGVTVRPGEFVQVPEHSPGEVEALEDTVLVCVSVPAH